MEVQQALNASGLNTQQNQKIKEQAKVQKGEENQEKKSTQDATKDDFLQVDLSEQAKEASQEADFLKEAYNLKRLDNLTDSSAYKQGYQNLKADKVIDLLV